MAVVSTENGTQFKPLTDDAKNLAKAFADEYKENAITKAELSAALDQGMTVSGPMPVASIAKMIEMSKDEEPKYVAGTKPPKMDSVKVLPVVSLSDVALGNFSPSEFLEVVEYKGLAFRAEQQKTTFNYEVKRIRALWDPTLSIPGTNRRGGWRCPTGTRYGGQITDRFGRNCGWGVARRIANSITNIGERLENIDDRRRGRRVERRNQRMVERLQNAERGAGRVERGLRGIAERLEGDNAQQGAPTAVPETRMPAVRRPQGQARRRRPQQKPQEVPVTPVQPRPQRRRRGETTENLEDRRDALLRTSERRRVRREIEQPGAARTDENAPRAEEPAPAPAPAPAPRRRRRNASEQRAAETANRRPNADAQPDAGEQPPKPKRRIEKEPNMEFGENGPTPERLRAMINHHFRGEDKVITRLLNDVEQKEQIEANIPKSLRENMARWRVGDINELDANVDVQENGRIGSLNDYNRALENFRAANNADDKEEAMRQLIALSTQYRERAATRDAMRARAAELRAERDGLERPQQPDAPQPQAPQAPAPEPEPQPQAPARVEPVDEKALPKQIQFEVSREYEDRIQTLIRSAATPEKKAALQNAWDLIKANANIQAVRGNAYLHMSLNSYIGRQISESSALSIRMRGQRFSFTSKETAIQELARNKAMLDSLLNEAGINPNNSPLSSRAASVAANIAILDNIIANWDADTMAMRRASKNLGFFNPNDAKAAQRREALGDIGGRINGEVADAINKRQGILAKYIDKRYGKSGTKPWVDMTPERFAQMTRAEQIEYVKSAYSHPVVEGMNGKFYRFNARVGSVGSEFNVEVSIDEVDKNGNTIRREIGTSRRTVSMNGRSVYNASFFIRTESDKGAGLQTVYNQHAFMYLKQAGVTKATVGAVDDGTFVWARIGFKQRGGANSRVQSFNDALRQYERVGPGGLISNEEEYWRVKYLVDQTRTRTVSHQEFIFAVASSTGDKKQRAMREEQIKQWFKSYAPFGSGELTFADQGINPNPGAQRLASRRPRGRRNARENVR